MNYLGELRALVGSRPLLIPGGRAVLQDEAGRVLFHRRSDLGIWDLPGGGAEVGESAPDCVVREVEEETGLRIERFVPIGLGSDPIRERVEYPNGDIIQGFSLILLADAWNGSLRLSNESTDFAFLDPAELPPLRDNIAATIAAVAAFERTGDFQLF